MLTEAEKTKILRHLGWPGKSIVPNSTLFSNWVNDRMIDLTPEIESCVRDLLDRLDDMDGKLEKAVCRASIKSVDGMVFRDDEIRILRRERYRIIKELARMLDIMPQTMGAMGSVGI